MVQDMYLKELKAYKPAPEKPGQITSRLKPNETELIPRKGEAEQHVQKFSMPKPPPSPEEADIQNDLKAYEDQVPEVEGQAASGESAPVQDWFEEPEEDDDETAHH